MHEPAPHPAPIDSSEAFDWRAIYHILREKLWIIILCVLIALGIAAYYAARAPELYAAFAVLQVEQQAPRIVQMEEVEPSDLTSEELVNTMIQTMTSGQALRRVVRQHEFHKDPEFMPAPEEGALTVNQAAKFLSKHVSAHRRKNTRLIDIVAKHPDPDMARKIANAVLQEFVEAGFRQRAEAARKANEALLKEAQRLREKLTSSEVKVFEFRRDHDAVSLEERQDIVSAQLKDANAKLNTAKADRVRLQADLAKSREIGEDPSQLIQIPSIAEHPRIANLKADLASKEDEMEVLKQRYKSKHPSYIELETEIGTLRETLYDEVLDVADQLDEQYAQAQQIEKEFAQVLKEQEQKQLALNKLEIHYNILTRDMEADRVLYDAVLARMKEINLKERLEESPITIVEPAWSSGGPIEPDKQKIMLAGALCGLVTGVGLALAFGLIENTFKTVDQVEGVLNLTVLAAVPQTQKSAPIESGRLPVVNNRRGLVAESFRSLRTSLLLHEDGDRSTSCLFTSAISAEGKSFCAANYALALSQQGLKTLLIDADLRLPVLADLFLEGRKSAGLGEYLQSKGGLELAVQTTHRNLDLLPAGGDIEDPSELLSSPRLAELLREARGKYDRIVLDTAPLIQVSDTLLLAPHVDSICLVIRAASTPRPAILRACRSLKEIGCKPAGVVLNCVPKNSRGFYYSYNPKDSYGREGIYGPPPSEKEKTAKTKKSAASKEPADAVKKVS